MKNLQIRSDITPEEITNSFSYKLSRFRDVRRCAHDGESKILVYPSTDQRFFQLAAKLFKVKVIKWQRDKAFDAQAKILNLMKGVVLVNPVLIAFEGTKYISVRCSITTQTEEEAKAYLVAQELMK